MGIFDRFGRWNRRRNLDRAVFEAARAAFPEGHRQFLEESQVVLQIIGPSFTIEDAGRILSRTKAMMAIARDKSRTRIVASMMNAHPGLKIQAAHEVYSFLSSIIGGDGPEATVGHDGGAARSPEDGVIVISNVSRIRGIDEEYAWIEARHGKRGRDWDLVMQMLKSDGDRSYDVLTISTSSGEEHEITFDITAFDRPLPRRARELSASMRMDGAADPARMDSRGRLSAPMRSPCARQSYFQQSAAFEAHARPLPLSTDELIKEPLTTVMCRGTSHPCAVGVEAMVIPGALGQDGKVPVCMILLTPSRHWASEIGLIDLRREPLSNAISSLAPLLVPKRPMQCPRVLMCNESFTDEQAKSLFGPVVRCCQGSSYLRDEILSTPHDPQSRVEAYLAQIHADREQYRREGAPLFSGEDISAAEAELIVSHLIQPSCMQAELQGLMQVWDMLLGAQIADGQVRYGADSQLLMRYLTPIMLTCRIA